MVYLVYGIDLAKSRAFVRALKSRFKHSQTKIIYADKSFDFKDFRTIIPTTSLFSDEVFVLIEFEKPPDVSDARHLMFLEDLQNTVNAVLWVGADLNKSSILLEYFKAKSGNNFTVRAFNKKPPTLNFGFVDMLNARSPKSFLILNKILAEKRSAGRVLSILAWNFRSILGIKANSEVSKLISPYAKPKMERASKNFSEREIINILKRIYRADVETKSGSRDIKSEMFSLVCYILNR